jgi:hypothetical protein
MVNTRTRKNITADGDEMLPANKIRTSSASQKPKKSKKKGSSTNNIVSSIQTISTQVAVGLNSSLLHGSDNGK